MIHTFRKIVKFKRWWVSTLVSCLPDSWEKRLTNLGSQFDLVVERRGNTVFLLNSKGAIIESVDIDKQAEMKDAESITQQDVTVHLSKSDLSAAANLVSDEDPPMRLSTTSLDFDTATHTNGLNDEPLDIVLNDPMLKKDARESNVELPGHIDLDNVVALSQGIKTDATVLLDNEDQTTRLLDSTQILDDDTIIVQGNQGKLLQFETAGSDSRESTILFCNDGGKIRQVDSGEFDNSELNTASENQSELDEYPIHSAEYGAVVSLLDRHMGNKKCLYILPENKVFALNLSYPVEVMQDIESVLRYDLEKHIPLSFKEIRYFYALHTNAQSKQVNVEVAVIKAMEFDLLNLSLSPFVKKGLFCTTGKFFEKYGRKINFLEADTEKNGFSILKLENIHLALNWLLLLAALTVPQYILYQKVQNQDISSPAEIERVKEILNSFSALDAELKFRSSLLEHINRVPRAVTLLDALSRHINEGAWLTRFSLKNNEIKLKGEADSATSVSDDLSSTGLFSSIKFVSSIVKNPRNGKETFELLLVLNSDE